MDNNYVLVTYDGDLAHAGVKGMQWGKRLYQNKDGSLTPLGRIHYGVKNAKTKAKRKESLKKANEARAAKKKAAEDAKAEEEALAKKKAELLQKPTAKEIYENRHLFTYQELNAAKMRIEMERNIKALEPAPVDKGKQFADNLVKNADTLTNVVTSGSKAYNSMAKVYNSLIGNKNGAALPMIEDKVVTSLDAFKNKTEWIKAENERKKAVEDSKEKPKSETEILKEKAELLKAKNELTKAEQGVLDNENKRREIERTSREHDRKDQRETEAAEKEAAKKAKDDADAKEKERIAEEMKKYEEYNKQYTEEPKSGSSTYSDSQYRSKGGDRDYVKPNESRGLTSTNNTSRGKSYADDAVSSNKTDAGVISKIQSMTSSGNKSYAEIADQLGISTSTVQNYSRGRDTTYELLDKYGNTLREYD